ncbi:unnamed protein product [Brachionus calyciflorus]|uniref:Uncharacterized protein n=1 Tax=Brachionus calyciflorus TaxID=104777 RepID=A0A814AI10_9BILA|nr:unnamed protein product [Brachionus calyciflorus]
MIDRQYEISYTRNKLYVINDAILLNQKQMLKDKEISVDTYVKYGIQTFDFSKIEAKLKENDNADDNSEAESIISNYSSSHESD